MGSGVSTLDPTTHITEATIRSDADRFSQMHSWWKHHRGTPGVPYVIFFKQGEQERNNIHPNINDAINLHMHMTWISENAEIVDALPQPCRQHPVVLTDQFEGHPGKPESDAEQARQRMLVDITQKAVRIAKELGVFDPAE